MMGRANINRYCATVLNETNQVSNNDDIQLFVDIIDGLNIGDANRNKYINLLKTKYNYNYIAGNDIEYIDAANLSDIKTIKDFRSYSNYKLYAEKLLRLREKKVNYHKFYNYSPTSINKYDLINLLERYKIKSHFTKRGIYSSPMRGVSEMSIDWAGNVFDKSHVLHEVAHFFDDKIRIPITYSLTDYGLTNEAECTCDSIMLYLLNKKYYKSILPKVGEYIEKNIPSWFFKLSNEVINNK